jgi:hypothetical protein
MFTKPSSDQFTWQDIFKVILAVMTFGFGWFADNQTTMIAFAAIGIVWILGQVAKHVEKFKWLAGKGPLTILVFVVSFVLSYLFQPFSVPALPAWAGDAGAYIPLLSAWLSSFFSVIGSAVLFAMSIYNILLVRVLEKVPPAFSNLVGK